MEPAGRRCRSADPARLDRFRCAALAASMLLAGTAPAHAQSPAQPVPAEQLLSVVLNGYDTGAVLLVEEDGGRVLAPLHALADLRLDTAGLDRVERQGRGYAVLNGASGIAVRIDRPGQRLLLDVADDRLERRRVTAGSRAPVLSPQVFSAFLDYDVVAETWRGSRTLGGLFEAGVADGWGSLSSSALYRSGRAPVRLDTGFVHDDPDGPVRYTLGDTIARPASWGRPARFGGVQIGRDYSLQPYAMRFAGPLLQGRAELPSTVEVYVDNVLRYRTEVDPGPFALDRVPLITGAGEAQVVVRDALGRQTAVTAPFIVSPRVLPEGESDFAVQAGFLRQDYARRSFSYGDPFAAGHWRHGLGGGTTLELAAEAARGWRNAGAGLAAAVAPLGEIELSGAGSRSKAGHGWLVGGSYRYVRGRVSAGVGFERSSPRFAQLGRPAHNPPTGNPIVQRVAATASLGLGALRLGDRLGSVAASLASVRFADGERSSVAALTYGVPLFDGAFLTAAAQRDVEGRDTTLALFLSMPLGPSSSASLDTRRNRLGTTSTATVQHRPLNGFGLGAHASVERGADRRTSAGLSWDGPQGGATIDAERSVGGNAARLSAAGSLVAVEDGLYAARKSRNGRAVVRVPGGEGLTVYAHNRPAGRLDRDGTALIGDLLPYQENRIAIDVEELPLTAAVARDHAMAVPGFRGTALVEFAVRDGGGAFVTVRLPDGRPLPAGVRLAGTGTGMGTDPLIGGEDGRVFVPGARAGTRLQVELDGLRCTVTLGAVDPAQPMPDLGEVPCVP